MNMPQLPNPIPSSSDAARNGSPFTEGAEKSAPDVGLNPPDHSEQQAPVVLVKPEILTVDSNSNTVKKVLVPEQGIAVVATRPGFYNQTRLRKDDEFFISQEEDLADWMSCVDPVFEKIRLQIIKEKKARL